MNAVVSWVLTLPYCHLKGHCRLTTKPYDRFRVIPRTRAQTREVRKWREEINAFTVSNIGQQKKVLQFVLLST